MTEIFLRKRFFLHELFGQQMILCPVLMFLALAFADDAFESFTMDMLDTIAPARGKDAIKITYKRDMLKVPVFRKIGKDTTMFSKPWSTDDFREILKKMGLFSGFEEILTPYHWHLRRGCSAAIQGNAYSWLLYWSHVKY